MLNMVTPATAERIDADKMPNWAAYQVGTVPVYSANMILSAPELGFGTSCPLLRPKYTSPLIPSTGHAGYSTPGRQLLLHQF